jgi:hypothetical protein
MRGAFFLIMIFSVSYNSALAVWAHKLEKNALLAWKDDNEDSLNLALEASADIEIMFANT